MKPRLLARAVVAVLLLIGGALAAVGAASAQTACAGLNAYSISGTIQGQDGAFINAQIGLNAVDRYGNPLTAQGCNSGGAYTTNIFVNTDVSGDGTFTSSGHTKTWSYAGLPSNTASVWVEVYTRTDVGSQCPTCDGSIDTSKYGFVNRRAIPVNTRNLPLTAPLACGLTSNGVTGSAGAIVGRFTDSAGDLVTGSVDAWSQASQSPMPALQGWGEGTYPASGDYRIPTLAAGQAYAVVGNYAGRSSRVDNVYVGSCGTAEVNFGPGQLGSDVALAPGGPSGIVAAWRAPNGTADVAVLRSGTLSDIGSLGGVLGAGPGVGFAGGTEVVLARGTNSDLYAATNSGSGWSGWRAISGQTLAAPELAAAANGSVWVAVTGTNHQIYLRRFSATGWTGWSDLGGSSDYAPAITVLADGEPQLAATATNHAVYTGTFTPRWTGWSGLGGNTGFAPSLVVDPALAGPRFFATAGGAVWTRTLSAGWSRTGASSAGGTGVASTGQALTMLVHGGDGFPYSTTVQSGVAGPLAFAG